MKVLITGGSGFIGSHLTDRMVGLGGEVVVLDRQVSSYPNPRARYILRDLCENLDSVVAEKFDVIYHLAAEVGSGLSMADPKKFVYTNSYGTANLIESLRRCGKYPKLIVSSSATVYGEATYRCQRHGEFFPDLRRVEQLEKREWEMKCPVCDQDAQAVAIKEDRPFKPASIYGQTKLDTELTALLLGRTWGFPVIVFRPFGVFGPRQSLGNPYTGVLAFFATRIFAGYPIVYYEDGCQNKGYTYIEDAIDLFVKALDAKSAGGQSFNMGDDRPVTIRYIAQRLAEKINPKIEIIASGKFRASDTRHSWPDISSVQRVFSWRPKVIFDEGMDHLIDWLRTLPLEQIKDSMGAFERAQKYAQSFGLEV